MQATMKKMLQILSRQAKIRLLILAVAIILGALLETVALSVITPFIAVFMDASAIDSNSTLSYIYNLFAFSRRGTFMAFLAFLLAFIYTFKSIYLFMLAKIQARFLMRRQIELADRLLTITLGKSYLYHVSKNLAEFQRVILGDSGQFIQFVTHVLNMANDVFMCIFIVAFLVILSPMMTMFVIALSLICTLVYFKIFRNKINTLGAENWEKAVAMGKAVNQALGGIKELKILQREGYFRRQFKIAGDASARIGQKYQVYSAIPRVFMEAIFFSGAFILVGILILSGADMESTVPTLSVFVLASFRLLPAVSRFTGYINTISYMRPSVDNIFKSLFEEDPYGNKDHLLPDVSAADVKSDIIVDNVSFKYPNIDAAVLENESLNIPYKKSVAFVGPTGAGKTTLADIILGIYPPQSGYVFFKGMSIHHNFPQWVKNVGYIPQQIYLLDETITENVAFGIDKDEIDENRVWESLEQAQLVDFVQSLPDGLETVVGDRGVRLSGGQRQRIGIARALYINPSILILDEATSSLDNETEKAVMEAIEKFQGEKTMIIIAHRLSTIENCDVIYRVENGSVFREK